MLRFTLFMLYILWNILSLCCGAFIWFQVCYWYMQEFFFNEIMKLKRLMKYIHLWAYLWLYNLYEYELVKVISYNRYLCKVVMACLIFSHWFNEDTFFSGTSLKKQQKLGYEMCIFIFCLFLHLPMYRRCLRYIFWKDEDRFQNIFVAHTLLNNMCGTRLIFT